MNFLTIFATIRVPILTYYTFSIIYCIMIVLGCVANLAIILACLGNKVQKNTRNIFILNIALSDLLLCLVTMPLTMMDLIHHYWPLGSGQVNQINYLILNRPFCHFSGSFVSTDRSFSVYFSLPLFFCGCPDCYR